MTVCPPFTYFNNFRHDINLRALKNATGLSGRKFSRMLKCLRLYDKKKADEEKISNRKLPQYDSQHKVRPYLDELVRSFQKQIEPGRYLVIDESMDKCTSRCGHKHKLPRKPIKEGLKYYYLCDEKGTILNINLHTKETLPYDAERGPLFSRTFMMLSGQNVSGGKSYLERHRTLFSDRLYTSPTLALELFSFQTYVVGTVICSRQNLPSDICKDKMSKKFPRGLMKFRHAGPLSYVNWYDSNVVKMLFSDPEYVEQVSVIVRRIQKSNKIQEINVPEVIKFYQKYMRGVDVA